MGCRRRGLRGVAGRVFCLLGLAAGSMVVPVPADDNPDYFYLDESMQSIPPRRANWSLTVYPRYYNVRGLFDHSGAWNFYLGSARLTATLAATAELGGRAGLAVYSGVVDHGSSLNPGTGLGESWVRLRVRPLGSLPLAVRIAARDPGDLGLWQYQPLTRAVDLSLAWEQAAKLWALNVFAGYRKRLSTARYEPGDEVHFLAEFALREEINGLSAGALGHYGFDGRFDGEEVPDTAGYLVTMFVRYFAAVTPYSRAQLAFLYDTIGRSRLGGFIFSASLSLHY